MTPPVAPRRDACRLGSSILKVAHSDFKLESKDSERRSLLASASELSANSLRGRLPVALQVVIGLSFRVALAIEPASLCSLVDGPCTGSQARD